MTASVVYYADESVTLYHGDALEVLRSLPDHSVDAVVTDPPYGLEFMGKEWDSFKAVPSGGAGLAATGYTDGGRRLVRPSFTGSPNPSCRNCGGTQRGADGQGVKRCHCDAPEFPNVGLKQSRAFGEWCAVWAAECLRVLKPGGHLLAFGGTRTVHRLTCAIEDAGFEIRDGIDWIYGSGFPKSLDVSKAIDKAAGAEREVIGTKRNGATALQSGSRVDHGYRPTRYDASVADVTAPATDDARRWSGWGTALKPAREPIVMARKPLAGTVAANVLAYGTGALNIDATRVAHASEADRRESEAKNRHADFGTEPGGNQVYGDFTMVPSRNYDGAAGRWPSNVVFSHAATPDGADLCGDGCVPGCPVAELDRQSGAVPASYRRASRDYEQRNEIYGRLPDTQAGREWGYVDSGGASRYFPVFRYEPKAPTAERPRADGVAHPTVKPLDLMRWLVRLVTPPGGKVLDLFAGSGPTGEACVIEGFPCFLIEREAAYLPLIVARLSKPIPLALFGEVAS